MTVLKGKNLRLRPVTVADVTPAYERWMNDPEVTRYLEVRFAPQSRADITAFVKAHANKADEPFFAMCLADGRHIGNIKLGPINPHHKTADISLVIGEKDCWGKGYAGEAIALVTRHAFETLKLEKLRAGCYAPNEGSAKAFEKCGFTREGLLKSHAVCDGKRVDLITLGLTRAQYETGRKIL